MWTTWPRKATAIARATGAACIACMAFGASGAWAAERHAAGGVVRFSGALVDRYDVTLVAPSGAVRHDARGASADVTFDAHDRQLPGARVVLADAHGTPLSVQPGADIRATWRDAAGERHELPRPDGAYRVGPYGGTMTVAASEADAAGPVVMKILHP
ncbi:hypothetical protein WT81_05530 [Burkholderia stagnalis]|uniref:hypothetical protein n=1 Tax=Burkholderia stagnalis TaxID=1503054 RepID=UPI00075F9EC0|nr:hypothetical protein [Burkholderia stagnalis]KWK47950.1 hypothetical protein WT80_18155 [Burkholderia stagnalis]KWK66728.1 hypothetical protein WT81_05530 [Burkholderia stagnalis]KWN73451.1 hypothetical protein WT90_15930 [Burkholderia stagnalis]